MQIYAQPVGKLVRYTCDGKECWARVDAPNGDPLYISMSPEPDVLVIKKSNLGLLGDKLLSLRAPHTLHYTGYLLFTFMANQQNTDDEANVVPKFDWCVPNDMIIYGVHLAICTELCLRAGSAIALKDYLAHQLIFYNNCIVGEHASFSIYKKIAMYSTIRRTINDSFQALGFNKKIQGFLL